MKRILQTRMHDPENGVDGNCYAAVIASILELDSAEDAIQIQEYYKEDRWITRLLSWLSLKGYILYSLTGHSNIEYELYLVSGKSPRHEDVHHICVYKNGKLYHDPHPDGTGIKTEEHFEIIEKIKEL